MTAALIVGENALVVVPAAPSVSWTVKLNGPEVVGVPVNVPVPALSIRLVGSDPAMSTQPA